MAVGFVLFTFCIISSQVLQLSASYRPAHHCPDLDLISVGRVIPYYTDEGYTQPVIGDVATYICVQGYYVVGDVTRTCILTVNGTAMWNGTEPHCEVLDCGDPGVPLHGKRRGDTFTFGSRVSYSCNRNTALVGFRTSTCNELGEWSNPRPLCRKYGSDGSCSAIQPVKNGLMVGGKKVGEGMWFICRHGYTMVGPSSVYCQSNATWSDSPPVCVSGCTNPPAITNGNADAKFVAVGDSINYSCDSCFEMVEPVEVTCLPNKTWSEPLPQCKQITCDNPMDAVSSQRNHEFYCGAEMLFECTEGFKMIGSNKLRCMETGNWSNHMPVCEYTPEIGNCPELYPPVNGSVAYSINATLVTAEYLCRAGYSLSGGDVLRYCNDSGIWSGTEPVCVDDDFGKCPFLDAPMNGFVVIRGFLHGDNATYFCNADYILMSGDHVRHCMTDGQWSGSIPSCQKVVPMCQQPDDLLNAQYTVSMPVSTTIDSDQLHHNIVVMGGTNRNATNVTDSDETALMFLLGSVVRYSCNDGYVMTGNDTLMCFSNGLWVGDIGSCERLQCPQPVEYENSYVLASALQVGSTATYHCYHGYYPDINSSMSITCQESGNWTELVPRCSPAVCEYPEVKDDVKVSGKGFTYASKGIRLKCVSKLARQRRKNTHSKCLADSTWSVQNFTCSDGQCPVDINFGVCNSTDFAFVGTVRVARRAQLHVVVEKKLYEGLPTRKNELKILLSDPDGSLLSQTHTCCKRITTDSTYIFAGNYNLNKNRVKFIVNGCRTIYRLPMERNTILDVDNIDHSFLEQCRFRMLSSSSSSNK